MRRSTATSTYEADLVVSLFIHTTADVDRNRFSGEAPDPFYFAMPQIPIEVSPIFFTVIDGEARLVKDEVPPGAHLPSDDSKLFKLVSDSRQSELKH